MATSKRPLKVSEERVQMYLQRRNQYLAAAITDDDDHEPEVDPYAFEDGDVKFSFSDKKDKTGGERQPGKKHKVGLKLQLHQLERLRQILFSHRCCCCRQHATVVDRL